MASNNEMHQELQRSWWHYLKTAKVTRAKVEDALTKEQATERAALEPDILEAFRYLTVQEQKLTLDIEYLSPNNEKKEIPERTKEEVSENKSKEPLHDFGYINWNKNHDFIKNKAWVNVSHFSSLINRRIDGIFDDYTDITYHEKVVDENNRFPFERNEIFINCRNPQTMADGMHMCDRATDVKSNPGLTESFWNNAKSDMHTRTSFEEEYRLTWVDSPAKPPDTDSD